MTRLEELETQVIKLETELANYKNKYPRPLRSYFNVPPREISSILIVEPKGFETDIECPDCNGFFVVQECFSKTLECNKCGGSCNAHGYWTLDKEGNK